MGMIWTAYRLDEARAEDLAERLVAEEGSAFDELDELGEELDVPGEGGAEAIDGVASDGESVDAAPGRVIDVDKAWHALDTLYATALAPSPISSGRVPDSEDVVVGLCPPTRVKAIVAGMERMGPEVIRKGYNAQKFTRERIYPEIWDEEDVLDVYVMPYDAELRDFYRAAAEADEAILWQLT